MRIRRLGLSGCGWLFPYHIGVLSYLQKAGVVDSKTILSGVSGGALVSIYYITSINHISLNIFKRMNVYNLVSVQSIDVIQNVICL